MKTWEDRINVIWQPPSPNFERISKYIIQVSDSEGSQNISVVSTTARIQNLKSLTKYEVKVHACARENDCGSPSLIYDWTKPKGTQNILLLLVIFLK